MMQPDIEPYVSAHWKGAAFEQSERTFANLVANGSLFTGIRRPKGFRQMMRKNCFRNAQILAIEGRATYVEGICVARSVPWIGFAHAWLTLDGEHAIDVTLDAESHAYFGIAFEESASWLGPSARPDTTRAGLASKV